MSPRRIPKPRGSAQTNRRRQGEPRELIIGLIAPIGVDRKPVETALRNQLRIVDYHVAPVKISEKLEKLADDSIPGWNNGDALVRKNILMNVGNNVREQYSDGGVLALLSMVQIASIRRTLLPKGSGRAYVIDSLKHPDEVELLRSIYGPAFVAIAVFASPDARRQYLEDQARTLLHEPDSNKIARLMERDEDENITLGQRVRAAFELADVVVDVSRGDTEHQIRRLVELLFGDLQKTPTIGEYAMSLARCAQARSGSLARQIGAAVIRDDGAIVSIGRNDVAKPFGGQYEPTDDNEYPRGRDINRGIDSSDWFRQKAITDLLAILQDNGQLNSTDSPEELFEQWYIGEEGKPKPWLRMAFIANTIDYVRAVHAEMAAITDAARHGIDLSQCSLYTTTFPCHDCAKHILASGIREVVYWAAYPKSLVKDLYDDSICVNEAAPSPDKVSFHSFVGIAPNRYFDFFIMGKRERKDRKGRAISFDPRKAKLTLPPYAISEEFAIYTENKRTTRFIEVFDREIDALHKLIGTRHQEWAAASATAQSAPHKRSRKKHTQRRKR